MREDLFPGGDLGDAVGLIVNRRQTNFFRISSNHWFALRPVDGVWFNFDSKLSAPEALEGDAALFDLLAAVLDGDGHVLIVKPRVDDGTPPDECDGGDFDAVGTSADAIDDEAKGGGGGSSGGSAQSSSASS